MKKILGSIMRICILLMFFYAGLFSGCSIIKVHDEELKPYVKTFGNTMGIKYSDLKDGRIGFRTLRGSYVLSDSAIGVCHYTPNKIYIDPRHWYRGYISEKSRVALIHHELGHCYCNLVHDNEMRKNGCPVSLMAAYTTSDSCLNLHWDDYIKELKEKCNEEE